MGYDRQRFRPSPKRMGPVKGVFMFATTSVLCLSVPSFTNSFVMNRKRNALTRPKRRTGRNIPGELISSVRSEYHPSCLRSKFGDDNELFDSEVLTRRIEKLRIEILEDEQQQPPDPNFSPQEFVKTVLSGLLNPYDPLPEYGFRTLLRSSTKKWRCRIWESIGAPRDADAGVVVSAFGEAISRPNNQFAILVGDAEEYYPSFPSEPLDYLDGTCWIECRLRDKEDHSLLAITGWQLRQRVVDGAWLVDRIDWQDFRDNYRPGIGREEWICEVR